MNYHKHLLFLVLLACSGLLHAQAVKYDGRTIGMPNYPCQKCHTSIEPSFSVVLPLPKPHSDLLLKHIVTDRSCYACHNEKNMDSLVDPISRQPVSFNESYKVCLNCHGDKTKDWQEGIHGKQVGSWNGDKFRYTCVECHSPHTPKFSNFKPDPPPAKPKFLINKQEP